MALDLNCLMVLSFLDGLVIAAATAILIGYILPTRAHIHREHAYYWLISAIAVVTAITIGISFLPNFVLHAHEIGKHEKCALISSALGAPYAGVPFPYL